MNTINGRILLIGLIIFVFGVGLCSASRMPYGAFLTQPVSSVDQLVNIIEQDSLVSSRYTSHFGMNQAALKEYFRNNVEVKALDEDTTYTVYFIQKGRVTAHKKTLKAGALIFITTTGVPIMDMECGNPIVKNLPKMLAKKPAPIVAVEPYMAELPVVEPTEILNPEPVEMEVLSEPPLEFFALVPPVMASASSSSWIVPTILGVGVIGNRQPVPEPGSMALLGIGVTGMISLYLKRRRS